MVMDYFIGAALNHVFFYLLSLFFLFYSGTVWHQDNMKSKHVRFSLLLCFCLLS